LNEGLPQEKFEKVLDEIREIAITRSGNRSILGTMNEVARYIEYAVYEDGLMNTDISELNLRINRIPCGAMNYQYSNEALRDALD